MKRRQVAFLTMTMLLEGLTDLLNIVGLIGGLLYVATGALWHKIAGIYYFTSG